MTTSRNWADVRMIIASISIALTLGFWSLFASREKAGGGAVGLVTLPARPDPIVSAPPALVPGQKLLFGGTAPQPPVVVASTTRRGGTSGGVVTTTRSSRP